MADLTDPNTQIALEHLHPAPIQPITAIEARDLPSSAEVDESSVLGAVRRMNPNAAAGTDHMSPRLFNLLVNSEVSPEAGVTGLSALTRLVARVASGNIPEQSLPLLAASTLLPICPKPNKIRAIAIGQALRRMVTKALLPQALADTRSFLAPQQLANGIPSAMDAIEHDARLLVRRHGNDLNYVMVTIDAKKRLQRLFAPDHPGHPTESRPKPRSLHERSLREKNTSTCLTVPSLCSFTQP